MLLLFFLSETQYPVQSPTNPEDQSQINDIA